jgi:integrase
MLNTNDVMVKPNTALDRPISLADFAAAAEWYVSENVFDDYRLGLAANSVRSQEADLATFVEFLNVHVKKDVPTVEQLLHVPAAWRDINRGLVRSFVAWLEQESFSLASINHKLSTVKVHVALAYKAGAITDDQNALVRTVEGLAGRRGRNVDAERTKAGVSTRKLRTDGQAVKKADWVRLDEDTVRQLKAQPLNTPQGRRDALLVALLADLGLRVGEVVILKYVDFDLAAGKYGRVHVHRPKVQDTANGDQYHDLTKDIRTALDAYIAAGDCPAMGPALRGSRKDGTLLPSAGMTERSASERIRELAKRLGEDGVSAHDLRHYWTIKHVERQHRYAKGLMQIRDAGGWASLAMVERYAGRSKIANAGMVEDED